MATRMGMRYPLDWWESIYIMDAARAADGLPVYEKFGEGHATHMYGPAGTYAIAAAYEMLGHPSIRMGRWMSLAAGGLATLLYLLVFVPRKRPFFLLVGTALVLSLHFRCMGLFTNTRPDITAYLLASIALVIAYLAHERDRLGWYWVSAGLIVLSFLFKQTYAVTALVPPIAILILRPTPLRKHLLTSLIPMAGMAVTAIVLKLAFPLVWFYAIYVPQQYRIFEERAGLGIDALFMHNPLFVVMAVLLIFVIGYQARRDRTITWLFVAMLIGAIMGIIAFAKQGGNYNSLLMAFGPMTAFCMLLLPKVMDVLTQRTIGFPARLAIAIALALMLSTTAFSIPMSKRLATDHASNRGGYSRTIALVRTLEGNVVCPEEPTITLLAKNTYEPSLEAELEAAWPKRILQPWITRYIETADWVITVSTADMTGRVGPLMPGLGFVKVDHPELGAEYTVWKRTVARPTSQPN